MEGELWKLLYRRVLDLCNGWYTPGMQHSDAAVVLVYMWAVLHDRPVSWACRQQNWPLEHRRWAKPSSATMSRRLRGPQLQAVLDELEHRPQASQTPSGLFWMDGKPLPVGGYSKDPDAAWGRGAGQKSKGYKLHVLWDASSCVYRWEVQPMPVSEQKVASRLLAQISGVGFVLADANYDANGLYEKAGEQGFQLLTPRRYRQARGLGHIRHSLWRLRAVRMIQDGLGPLLRSRTGIERQFGSMGNFPGGMGPLPHWVRRLQRVRRWVQAKLIINAQRIQNTRLSRDQAA